MLIISTKRACLLDFLILVLAVKSIKCDGVNLSAVILSGEIRWLHIVDRDGCAAMQDRLPRLDFLESFSEV